VPGLTPTSPIMTVEPVLITDELPRTAKLCVLPSGGATWAIAVGDGTAVNNAASKTKGTSLVKEPRNVCIRIVRLFIVSPYRERLHVGQNRGAAWSLVWHLLWSAGGRFVSFAPLRIDGGNRPSEDHRIALKRPFAKDRRVGAVFHRALTVEVLYLGFGGGVRYIFDESGMRKIGQEPTLEEFIAHPALLSFNTEALKRNT
jgi:hypothetical protein